MSQISFHHFPTLISFILFHFICPCDGASGKVGWYPWYSQIFRGFIAFHPSTWPCIVIVVVLGFKTLLTSWVISVASLILAWGSFTCHKSMTLDPQLYFPSEGSHTQDFNSQKIQWTRPVLNPRTSDPVESMITMGPTSLLDMNSGYY